ncbi:hypothetical protein [Vibrio tritonius]|uniref:hypothetical protein n=1 Tax=Vibrio tritonius TaxID=1435069 RepID=UPI00315DC754
MAVKRERAGFGTFGQPQDEGQKAALAANELILSLEQATTKLNSERDLPEEQSNKLKELVLSLSDKLSMQEQLSRGFDEGKTRITLILNKEPCLFELVTIPAGRILTDTIVDECNERNQEFVNRLSVIEMAKSISDRGQTYPAIGYRNGDKINVIDGSQRRFGCHVAEVDFLIYVSDSVFSNEVISETSEATNVHKRRSLIENGRKWKAEIANGQETGAYKNATDFANKNSITRSLLTDALKAANLPDWLISTIPSPADLGRPNIIKLDGFLSSLNEKEFGQLRSICETKLKKSSFELIMTSTSAEAANQEIIAAIMNALKGSSEQSNTSRVRRVLTPLTTGGRGAAEYSNGCLKIEIRDANEEYIEQLRAVLLEQGLEF